MANRTSDGIFLEVTRSIGTEGNQGIFDVPRLWTPFGEVKLTGGGSHDKMHTLIENLFGALGDLVEIITVDQDINHHEGNEVAIRSEKANPRFWFVGKNHGVQLFLLKFKDGYSFSDIVNVEPSDLHVFTFVCLRRITNTSNTVFANVTDNAKAF